MSTADWRRTELMADADGWIVVIRRTLRQTPEQVWAALTMAADLPQWAPFRPDRNLDSPGPVLLTDLGVANPGTHSCHIDKSIAPQLLVLTWGTDTLRWELTAAGSGTVLILRHRFSDQASVGSYAAGWHLCLEALIALLDGHPMESVVGENAIKNGYQALADGYAKFFGVPLPAPQDAR